MPRVSHVRHNSMLEQAKAYPAKRRHSLTPTEDELQLALAFMKGEVGIAQVAHVMGVKKPSSASNLVMYRMGALVRNGVIAGRIIIIEQ
jgi:hypothetical protein